MHNFRLLLLPLMLLLAFVSQAADPTQPPGWLTGSGSKKTQTINKDKFNLQQILIGKERRSAVINNQLVTKGSRVAGAQVVAINNNSVVLKVSQKRLTLSLLNKTKQAVRRNKIGK